jgi:hypothetical protein
MKTVSAIIALLLFSLIFYINCGGNKSTDLTSPSSNNYYPITLKISGIVTGKNNNPVDTASVEIWNWNQSLVENTKTNERGEYSFNIKVTINSDYMPNLTIQAKDYTINDAGETEYWKGLVHIGMTDSLQVLNIQLYLTYQY